MIQIVASPEATQPRDVSWTALGMDAGLGELRGRQDRSSLTFARRGDRRRSSDSLTGDYGIPTDRRPPVLIVRVDRRAVRLQDPPHR